MAINVTCLAADACCLLADESGGHMEYLRTHEKHSTAYEDHRAMTGLQTGLHCARGIEFSRRGKSSLIRRARNNGAGR